MARRFTLEGAQVLIVEKNEDSGYEEFMQIHQSLGLPVLKTSALVVAWSDAEAEQLRNIQTQAFQVDAVGRSKQWLS